MSPWRPEDRRGENPLQPCFIVLFIAKYGPSSNKSAFTEAAAVIYKLAVFVITKLRANRGF